MSDELDEAHYLNLATFRRDGREVRTPVWFAGASGRYYVFSAGDAGKVKRVRRDGTARVAACDVRGRVRGRWYPAHARLARGPDEVAAALVALRRKYGWQMWLADVLAKLTGRFGRRAYLVLELGQTVQDTVAGHGGAPASREH
jgi:uncharacterized protein